MNHAPASWTAVTSEAESPLWLANGGSILEVGAHGPCESGDLPFSLSPHSKSSRQIVASKATIRGLNLVLGTVTNES